MTSLRTHTLRTPRQTTRYLEAGPSDGPLMFFLHGWPSIGLIWRAQLEALGAEGWHCIAPDLRGFGDSAAPASIEEYAIREAVEDMVELHDHVGGGPAVWVGHDWGSIVVGAVAAHHPPRCRAIVLVSWAYFPDSNALETLVPLVDRTIYPADRYPDGQWDYYRYYVTDFDSAVADLDADVTSSLASIYRPGDPAAVGQVAPTATVSRTGGRFGSAHRAPATEPHPDLWPAADFDELVRAFSTHGFRTSCAWYLNDAANIDYARQSPDDGRLSMPVLFVNGDEDVICSIRGDRQGEPMMASCADLTVQNLPAGHWLPLEQKEELTETIREWIRVKRL
ncbi:MAG TPA: alpha/beta hydrolase [Pseudolysinimonas sp.]|nr:alpha/beta hydrolase [Pseudolysinimonas sp.]